MTISLMCEKLASKEMDPHIDALIPPLLKKAADSNHFISESAENGLITICTCLNE
jgi:hypothetical protein